MDQRIADEIMRLLGYDPDYVRELIADDVALGLKQSDEMNENMRKYGTIDAPKSGEVDPFVDPYFKPQMSKHLQQRAENLTRIFGELHKIQSQGRGLRESPGVKIMDYVDVAKDVAKERPMFKPKPVDPPVALTVKELEDIVEFVKRNKTDGNHRVKIVPGEPNGIGPSFDVFYGGASINIADVSAW